MATFDTMTHTTGHVTDAVTGKKVKNIIEQYLNDPITIELCDKIVAHVQREFGENHPAQVNLNDETHEIEIIVKDRNGKYIKCSSLTLFPEAYL